MAIVQQSNTTFGSATSASRTFASTPTAGRLLICAVSVGAGTITAGPAGWTELSALTTGNMRAAWWYKYAAGDESVVSVSMSSGFGSMSIAEYDDAVSGPPVVAENEASASTVVTSIASGTAAATAASGLAISFFAADNGNNADGSRTYSNGFTERTFQYAAGSDRASVGIATRTFSAAGSYSCTFGVTDTGDEMYGAIALFGASTTISTASVAVSGSASVGVVSQARATSSVEVSGSATVATVAQARMAAAIDISGSSAVAVSALSRIAASLVVAGSSTIGSTLTARAIASAAVTGTAAVAISVIGRVNASLAIQGSGTIAFVGSNGAAVVLTPSQIVEIRLAARTATVALGTREFTLNLPNRQVSLTL